MAEEQKRSGRVWLWIGAGAVLIAVFFSTRAMMREKLPVRVARVGHQTLVNTVSTNGLVEPVQNYEIHSPLATTVKALYVQPGDAVPAGKLLLELDDMQARARVASAESGVSQARTQLDAARLNGTAQERQASASDTARAHMDRDDARRQLESLSRLKATGAASASEVAAAQQRLDAAEAAVHAAEGAAASRYSSQDVARAQAALDDARAGLAVARQALAQCSPRSPIAGTVYSVGVERSDFVEEGKMLLQMADLRHERVRAYFDEPEIGELAVGQKIQIKWEAKLGHVWQGHIIRTPVTVISYGTRNVGEVLIEVDDADGVLLPETHVTVTVTVSSEPNALSIPREALHSENGKPYVYKVVGDSLVRTAVTIGTPNLTLAPILTGLTEGDVVATGTTNGTPLQEGVPIKEVK
jgi:HlyD family secretion protein